MLALKLIHASKRVPPERFEHVRCGAVHGLWDMTCDWLMSQIVWLASVNIDWRYYRSSAFWICSIIMWSDVTGWNLHRFTWNGLTMSPKSPKAYNIITTITYNTNMRIFYGIYCIYWRKRNLFFRVYIWKEHRSNRKDPRTHYSSMAASLGELMTKRYFASRGNEKVIFIHSTNLAFITTLRK